MLFWALCGQLLVPRSLIWRPWGAVSVRFWRGWCVIVLCCRGWCIVNSSWQLLCSTGSLHTPQYVEDYCSMYLPPSPLYPTFDCYIVQLYRLLLRRVQRSAALRINQRALRSRRKQESHVLLLNTQCCVEYLCVWIVDSYVFVPPPPMPSTTFQTAGKLIYMVLTPHGGPQQARSEQCQLAFIVRQCFQHPTKRALFGSGHL